MARNARKNKSLLPGLLFIVGTIFVGISTVHNLLRLRSLKLDRITVASYQQATPPQAVKKPIPTHIFIQWFVNTGIEEEVYVGGKWTVSETQASYLSSSGKPGETGNLILYGHNKRSILGNLRALKGGEIIELTLDDDTTKRYRVESLKQVDPRNTELLRPTDTEVLTLYTCSGFMDSQRFVVRATPLNESSPDAVPEF